MTGDLVRNRLRTSVPFSVRTLISIIDALLDQSSGGSADAFAKKCDTQQIFVSCWLRHVILLCMSNY